MRTLKNHIILYDAECPMCNLYTGAFTKTGMLDRNGRAPYQGMPAVACPLVDTKRAVDEIALVDTLTGEVKYGIDSLFAVLANTFPIFRPLFTFRPFAWLMRKAYAFISYNRKVIIPPPAAVQSALQPTFHLRYRIAYLLFTCAVVGWILTGYTPLLAGVVPLGGPYREFLICGGQVIFQGVVLTIYAPRKLWEYLGNMMTISLAGALLLTLPLLARRALDHAPLLATFYFLIVVGLMFLEHIRRTRLLGLHWIPTITWAGYRLIILCLMFIF